MAEINARLRRALDGPAPQHKVAGEESFEFTEGSDGAQHTKIVDVNGNPISVVPTIDSAVESRLDSMEKKLDSVIENGAVNTQLTGSIMEDYVKDEESMPPANSVPLGAFCMVVDTGNIWQSDGVDWKVFA